MLNAEGEKSIKRCNRKVLMVGSQHEKREVTVQVARPSRKGAHTPVNDEWHKVTRF